MSESEQAGKPVARAYRNYLDAKTARHLDGRGTDRRQHEVAIWRAVLEAARAYHRPSNRRSDVNEVIESFPQDMAFAIAEILEELLDTGHLPAPFVILLQVGSSGRGVLAARRAAIWAARYMLEVHAGRIDDPAPNKTVREAFGGISDTLVRQWVKKYRAEAEASMRMAPLDREEEAGLVLALLQAEGREYQHFGRRQR